MSHDCAVENGLTLFAIENCNRKLFNTEGTIRLRSGQAPEHRVEQRVPGQWCFGGNSSQRLCRCGQGWGPFGFAQGRLFDCATARVREAVATLRVTGRGALSSSHEIRGDGAVTLTSVECVRLRFESRTRYERGG